MSLREAVEFVTALLDTRERHVAEFVIVEAGGDRYVQFSFDPDRIYAESVGDAYLGDGWLLTDAEERMLATLGWDPPADAADPDQPHWNYSREWRRDAATKTVVDALFLTLVAVHLRGEGDPLTVKWASFDGDGEEECEADDLAA